MIPSLSIPENNKSNTLETSKTYLINFNKDRIQNKIDGLEAVKQSIFMMLNTQKQAFSIYPLNYGVDLNRYVGKDKNYIIGDLPREIKESLMRDERILNVENFQFSNPVKFKDNLIVTFDVITIFGELSESVVIPRG